MDHQAETLFHALVELSPGEREAYFRAHTVPSELRSEVEALLRFDTGSDKEIVESVAFLTQKWVGNEETETVRFGPYRLIRLLGTGGMGSVYLAERVDGEVEQRVAVKFLHSSGDTAKFRDRFLRERQILAKLSHSGIARLIDAGHTAQGRPYLAMDYIEGTPIDAYSESLDLRAKLALFLRVSEAVSYAHRNLIVHRDLKPSNILVDSSGTPKLLDFGIAKIIDEGLDQTGTQDRLLTPEYASPEQIRGSEQSTATDIYSLGAILYKLLTGRSPHASSNGSRQELMNAVLNAEAPVPSVVANVPRDLDFIVAKALRKEPEERYPSVEAIADDVRAFLEFRPVRTRSANFWYRSRKFVRRYWIPVSAAAVAIISLAAGLYIAERQRAIAEGRVAQLRQLSLQQLQFESHLNGQTEGELQLHNKMVADSIQYLESLRPEALRDKQLALQIGAAYLRVARIQGVPEWNQMGRYAEAEKSLSKAAEMANAVLATDPTNREAIWQVANVAHDRAVVAYAERRPEEVMAWSPKAVEGFDRLARLGNLTRREINGATYIYGDLAEVHTALHRFQDAIRYARLGIDYSRNTSTVPGPRAQAFNMLAGALTYLGDLQGAQEAIRQARQLWEQLRRDEGDTGYTRSILYQTRCREGLLLGEEGGVNLNRPKEAADRLQEAFDATETFAQASRADYYSRDCIATAGHYLGDVLRRTNPRRALEVYDHSLMRIREVPSDVSARRLEVLLLAASSYAARGMHREGDAMARIDSAFRLLRDIGDYPAAVLKPGSEADIAVRALADHDAETGQFDQAIRSYQELRRSLLASNPDPRSDLLNAVSLTALDASLAALLRRAGAAEQAAALEAGNREIWRHWEQQLPGNPFVHRELTASH